MCDLRAMLNYALFRIITMYESITSVPNYGLLAGQTRLPTFDWQIVQLRIQNPFYVD